MQSHDQDYSRMIELLCNLQILVQSDPGMAEIDFPCIVTIGEQSCGKSSLLQTIVGHKFLPTGGGMVTRSPVVITVLRETDRNKAATAWFQNADKRSANSSELLFEGESNATEDFSHIRDEIVARTERLLSQGEEVSDIAICVFVKTIRCRLPLTLIDLPGTQMHGSAAAPIRDLCLSRTNKSNAIILAVMSATHDPTNQPILRFVRAVDPKFERTIGVLTRIDALEEDTATTIKKLAAGEDMSQRLESPWPNFKYGYIPVYCKAETDDPQSEEQQWFSRTSLWHDAATKGTEAIAKIASKVLVSTASRVAAACEDRATNLLHQHEEQLNMYRPLRTPDDMAVVVAHVQDRVLHALGALYFDDVAAFSNTLLRATDVIRSAINKELDVGLPQRLRMFQVKIRDEDVQTLLSYARVGQHIDNNTFRRVCIHVAEQCRLYDHVQASCDVLKPMVISGINNIIEWTVEELVSKHKDIAAPLRAVFSVFLLDPSSMFFQPIDQALDRSQETTLAIAQNFQDLERRTVDFDNPAIQGYNARFQAILASTPITGGHASGSTRRTSTLSSFAGVEEVAVNYCCIEGCAKILKPKALAITALGQDRSRVVFRHRCRSCQRSCCAEHSKHRVPVQGRQFQKAVRVCDDCHRFRIAPATTGGQSPVVNPAQHSTTMEVKFDDQEGAIYIQRRDELAVMNYLTTMGTEYLEVILGLYVNLLPCIVRAKFLRTGLDSVKQAFQRVVTEAGGDRLVAAMAEQIDVGTRSKIFDVAARQGTLESIQANVKQLNQILRRVRSTVSASDGFFSPRK